MVGGLGYMSLMIWAERGLSVIFTCSINTGLIKISHAEFVYKVCKTLVMCSVFFAKLSVHFIL